jgi:hypothetical protein
MGHTSDFIYLCNNFCFEFFLDINVIGVVHAWVGQKLLNCFIFKCFTRKTLKKISIGHR